jgi:putative SOS response-associated peptidase YedK
MLVAMCERYVIPSQDEVEQEVSLRHGWWKFAARFNIGIHQNVPVIRIHAGESEGVMMRWGLIPAWAEGKPPQEKATHADIESMERALLFKESWWQAKRCILPAAGFYVWQLTPQRHRQPFFVRLVNRPVFGMAGLWASTQNEDGDDVIESCALVTVPSNDLMKEVSNTTARMPAILRREDYQTWLTGTPAKAKALLQTYPQERMLTHPVSPRVNRADDDDPALIRAVL